MTPKLSAEEMAMRWSARTSNLELQQGESVEFQFKITFKEGQQVMAVVTGRKDVAKNLTMGECAEGIHQAEQFLERLTGLRVHIEQVG